jgi:hypothetical protein
MVNDQLQVWGEKRIILEQVQQVDGARTGRTNPLSGQIVPYGNACRTPGAHARLSFVPLYARLFRRFELFLDLFPHAGHIINLRNGI